MNYLNFIFIILTVFFYGCTTPSKATIKPQELTLDNADQIVITQTTSKEVLDRFGAPSYKIPIEEPDRDVWIYCEIVPCSDGRLIVHFAKETNTVQSVTWTLIPSDGNRSFEDISKRYPKAKFRKKRFIYNFGDFIDRVVVWQDKQTGITLSVDIDNSTIKSITRRNPLDLLFVKSKNKVVVFEEWLFRESNSDTRESTRF